MDQQSVSIAVILILIVAAFVVPGIATGIVLSMMRKPITSQNPTELVRLREEVGRLREEVERLSGEVGQLNAGARGPRSNGH